MRVLDTDVCVEILRGNDGVIARRRQLRDEVVTTWITAAELFFGAARSRAPAGNAALVRELLATVGLVGVDMPAAERFGELKAGLQREGRRLADADLLIAAITLVHGAILVTGNTRHYQRITGLSMEDWIRAA